MFEAFLRSKDITPSTARGYLSDLEKFRSWFEEETGSPFDPRSVDTYDVSEYKRGLLGEGKKPSTVNRALSALKEYFRWAVEEGLCPDNPCERVRQAKASKPAPRALDLKEQHALMRAVLKRGKSRDVALITLLLHTGLRVGELARLEMADVAVREDGGLVVVRSGKGAKRREVPLNESARRALKRYLSERGKEDGPLFLSQKGGRLSASAVERLVRNYGRAAGLEGVSPHALRHSFCKSLIDAGESIDRVAQLAGHTRLDTTARYTRPSARDLEKAVARLDLGWS